eukprot:5144284-Prymnesium_polylepis.1
MSNTQAGSAGLHKSNPRRTMQLCNSSSCRYDRHSERHGLRARAITPTKMTRPPGCGHGLIPK